MTMNRRRFLYTSVCGTAGSFLSTSAQEQVPAQSAPKTLLEYRGSNAAVDRFRRGNGKSENECGGFGLYRCCKGEAEWQR